MIRNLWRAAVQCFPDTEPGALKLRTRMVLSGLRMPSQSRRLLMPEADSALAAMLAARPQMRGVLVWPYLSALLTPQEWTERLFVHFDEIDTLPPEFRLAPDEKSRLLDLSTQFEGLSVVLDQPPFMMREGGLTLNLFVQDFRAFSISFALARRDDGQRMMLIGGIQGRNREDALDLYRALTKALYGIRPRDFTIEALRLLAIAWDVAEIRAVSDAARHHRHPFFGKVDHSLNYDDIWEDRGGHKLDDAEYLIPLRRIERPLEDIPARKRSLYRKRYALLAGLDEVATARFPDARRLMFDAD